VRRRLAFPSSAVPKRWTRSVQTALVHVMSLAHYALVHTRSRAVNGRNHRARLAAKCDQLDHEVRLLRDEIRIKDARLVRIPADRRPHYAPTAQLTAMLAKGSTPWTRSREAAPTTGDAGEGVVEDGVYGVRGRDCPAACRARGRGHAA
jgi:hypothetical protein